MTKEQNYKEFINNINVNESSDVIDMVADDLTRLFLGDSKIALRSLPKSIKALQKMQPVLDKSPRERNDDYNRLYTMFRKVVQRSTM